VELNAVAQIAETATQLQRNSRKIDIFDRKVFMLSRGHTKESGKRNATAISEKCRRFQAGNWF
jgi:hypothetical protein